MPAEAVAQARLMIAASEVDADLHYATRFLAPDPFIFLETRCERILLMSDLEVDRARAEAQVDTVLPLSRYEDMARRTGIDSPTSHHALQQVLQERAIKILEVPRSFPIEAADFLRDAGYHVAFPAGSFFPEREQKSAAEVDRIRKVQGHAETAMDAAIASIRETRAEGDLLYQNGEPLTSESLKRSIARVLMDCGCSARHTIVACGDQACDPHNQGSGPLRIGQPIILDIFPRSDSTGYYGDITRTVVKGRPTDEMGRLYEAVLEGQLLAIDQIRSGADGKAIHQAVLARFEKKGFHTGEVDGHMQGFFHGTGHGVGLEIHEPPRISKASGHLRAGHVVTVEPGLYYPGRGAVRIEDLVLVTESGCDNLTSYPKEFEV